MQGKARHPKETILKDGFYIEVRNIGSFEKAVKIRCDTMSAMEDAINEYGRNKEIVILGEHKDSKWLHAPVKVPLPKKISYAY